MSAREWEVPDWIDTARQIEAFGHPDYLEELADKLEKLARFSPSGGVLTRAVEELRADANLTRRFIAEIEERIEVVREGGEVRFRRRGGRGRPRGRSSLAIEEVHHEINGGRVDYSGEHFDAIRECLVGHLDRDELTDERIKAAIQKHG